MEVSACIYLALHYDLVVCFAWHLLGLYMLCIAECLQN